MRAITRIGEKKTHIYTVSLSIHVNIIRAHAIDVLVELFYPLSLTVVKYRGSRGDSAILGKVGAIFCRKFKVFHFFINW